MREKDIPQNLTTFTNSYIKIGEREIPYKIRFSKKSSYLSIQIHQKGFLLVVIPRSSCIKDAENFIIAKRDWIVKHFRPAVKKLSPFMLFGKEVRITQQFDTFLTSHSIRMNEDFSLLTINSPSGSKISVEKLYNAWLKHFAGPYIRRRVYELAQQHGFKINRLFIRGQKTKWGTCSCKGNISINYNLVRFRKELIDYVIMHEFCHLKEMNHSPRFWDLLGTYCPDYKILRKKTIKPSKP